MIFFFDETFRTSLTPPGRSFGALCGVGIPQEQLATIAQEVFHLKRRIMGNEFAMEEEMKGKDLFKNYAFKLERRGISSRNLQLGDAVLDLLHARHLPVFGCVSFDDKFAKFQVSDVAALDKTFRYLFERVDMWMKIHHPQRKAMFVFDDRDFGVNQRNAEAITRFFQRSQDGARLDSIIQTPFFAISQTHNVGLQLADLVTTVIGLRFASHPDIKPHFTKLKGCIPEYQLHDGTRVNGIKVLRDVASAEAKKKTLSGLAARGRDKKAQHSASTKNVVSVPDDASTISAKPADDAPKPEDAP